MIDSKWRGGYQRLCVKPLLPYFSKCSPLTLTLFGLISGLCIPFLCLMNAPWMALIALALSGYFDTLDGTVARERGLTSPLGAVLDITADRAVEFAAILGLFLIHPQTRGLLCILMLGSAFLCITTFLVVGIFTRNDSEKSFYYSPGLIERSEAFLLFGAMLSFPSLFGYLAGLFTIMVLLTALIRLIEFRLALRRSI